MDTNEVNIAFEILLEELETVVNSLNENGANAFQAGDYDRARQLADDAGRLTDYHDKVRGLQDEWGTLFAAKVPKSKATRKKSREKLRRGLRTPESAFRKPILEALVELGGGAPNHAVLDLVGRKMKGTLNEYDRQRLSSGPTHEVRWRNSAMWCRYKMARQGLLKSDSQRGVWEIADKGRRALTQLSKSANNRHT